MDHSEFSSLMERAKRIVSELTHKIRGRQLRKELRLLSETIDELERLHSNDPPISWDKAVQLFLMIVDSSRKLIESLK